MGPGAMTDCVGRGNGRHLAAYDKDALAVVFANARKEFVTHGYAGTKLDEVACRSGVSVRSVNRLFPTKVDLLRGVIADRLDHFLEEMANAINERDLVTSLARILVRCADLLLDHEAVALNRIVIAESKAFPEIADAYYEEGMQRVPIALAAWLAWHSDRGALRVDDPNATASMLVGMMTSELQRKAILGRPPNITAAQMQKRARACAVMFLDGCAVQ
jgi:AcrR family transcriptional regulator